MIFKEEFQNELSFSQNWVAIVGSAYIGSGLLAARMAFFSERLRRWQAAPVPPGVKARG